MTTEKNTGSITDRKTAEPKQENDAALLQEDPLDHVNGAASDAHESSSNPLNDRFSPSFGHRPFVNE